MSPKIIKNISKYDEETYERLLNRTRIVYLCGEICSETAYEINKKLKALSIQHPNKIITLEINSPGGDIAAGMSIVDTIINLNTPIHTIITGEACSMASLISIVGTKRFITKHSAWMTHASSTFVSDKVQNAMDRLKYEKKLEKNMDELYKKYTNLTEKDLDVARRGELWLNAKECLKKEIVDKIL